MDIYELESAINDLIIKVNFGEATEEEKRFLYNTAHEIGELFTEVNYYE
jgi:hypothetical protein